MPLNTLRKLSFVDGGDTTDETLFGLIAKDIENQGYSIRPNALPESLALLLYTHQQDMHAHTYVDAGVGRGENRIKTEFIRTDEICWITDKSDAGSAWIDWTSKLQTFLNRKLFLGLFSFESHFAHYSPGDYYKRHLDAFRGEANRVLSIVVYLNPGWCHTDGGELVLFANECDREGTKVVPLYGTVVAFLSEEFPHEVLPASRDRYSIAGWYRLNASLLNKVDPPQ